MQLITVEELINYKILPFNIYTKGDKLLFPAGEVLTPGKFLQLRHIDMIYRKPEEEKKSSQPKKQPAPAPPSVPQPEAALPPMQPQVNESSIDSIEIRNVVTTINKQSQIPADEQIKLKVFYENTVGDIHQNDPSKILGRMKELRDKILNDYTGILDKAIYSSQFRLLGEYDRSHAINVAMLTAALSRKLGKPEDFIRDIILAALLHDIGKICLPKTLTYKQGMTIQEQKLYQAHTKIGYNLIKNKMNLGEKIAKVALEHHERNDGTGFPHGKSGEFISLESQIISVCNYFDNLTFNRTPYKISNTKEALKTMLEIGSKGFAIDILYTFIYMYNYDDTKAFEEMIMS